ncbi:hypothetical protein [uncultured Desulfobulbus sp.]|uniref:hypothetical protein n=1 Tax=uncultured Desulfobulbus sp. TaxID=239745 RepID=UPI0029C6538A|nr:hypothetical protein [uncultured Desulfobulbus sp.]
MKRSILLSFSIAITVNAYAQQNANSLNPANIIVAARPDVQWDISTFVEGDFNDDGKKDYAIIGYKGAGIVLAVRTTSAQRGESSKTQYLPFDINPSMQAAICEKPATLHVEKQVCSPIDEPLPGCKPSNTANSLNLIGGACDPIRL